MFSQSVLIQGMMAKTKEELREARKQWFAQMEQKLQEMHTKEEDSLFYYHSSEDRSKQSIFAVLRMT